MDEREILRAERWLRPHRSGPAERLAILAYPNTYHVGMSNLGFQVMRQAADDCPGWQAERMFLPEGERAKALARSPSPLRTFERRRLGREASVLAVSVSYEVDFANIVRLLELAGLPGLSADRDESMPLVVLGGACASINIEPVADFCDVVCVGEGDELFPELLVAVADSEGAPRAEQLEGLASIPGVYVPSLYASEPNADGCSGTVRPKGNAPERVQRRTVKDLDAHETASTILTPHTEFADTRLVELSRGCPRACRFCVMPTCCNPARFRSADAILAMSRSHERIGLLGAAASDHPQIEEIVLSLEGEGVQLSISASRAEPLSEATLAALARAGQRTLTLAPETGVAEVSEAIRKGLSQDDVVAMARTAASVGFRNLKLYYMIGLPGAGDCEVEAILQSAEKVCLAARGLRVAISANPFVPKPGTPFQWAPMEGQTSLKRKAKALNKGAFHLPGHPKAFAEGPRFAVVEALLARGDRRLSSVLQAVARGAAGYSDYRRGVEKLGLDLDRLVHAERDADAAFPWEVIDTGMSRERLLREWEDAKGRLGLRR